MPGMNARWAGGDGATFGPTSGRAHMPVAGTYPLSAIKDAVAHAQRGGKISFLTSPDAPPITPIVRDCDETIVVQRLQRVGEGGTPAAMVVSVTETPGQDPGRHG